MRKPDGNLCGKTPHHTDKAAIAEFGTVYFRGTEGVRTGKYHDSNRKRIFRRIYHRSRKTDPGEHRAGTVSDGMGIHRNGLHAWNSILCDPDDRTEYTSPEIPLERGNGVDIKPTKPQKRRKEL
jgi:hypothetical protein